MLKKILKFCAVLSAESSAEFSAEGSAEFTAENSAEGFFTS